MSAKRRASSAPSHHQQQKQHSHQHHHQQQQHHNPEQLRSRSQSLGSATTFLDGWRSRMPFMKRRQTIDNSRQCQPLMEERETSNGGATSGASGGGGAAPMGSDSAELGASNRPTLMTTIAEDVAEANASDGGGRTTEAGAGDGNPNGMGTVIVRMESSGQQPMADEAL